MNTEAAIAVLDELVAAGVHDIVASPGSRSTPLILAADSHPAVRLHVHFDERAAGFFALGIAKATQRPVAIITTSGTAVANLLPAMAEAHHANIPLIAVTADRPPKLRNRGANQTMDQVNLFDRFVRAEGSFVAPEPIGSIARAASRWPPGPVHINYGFDKPLEPDAAGREALEALAARPAGVPAAPPGAEASGDVPNVVPSMIGPRGLIVCGPGTGRRLEPLIRRYAQATGAVVVADALSGIRFREIAVDGAEMILSANAVESADWVVQFGTSPTSNGVRSFIGRPETERYRVDASGRGWDDIDGGHLLTCDAAKFLQSQLQAIKSEGLTPMAGAEDWQLQFERLDELAWASGDPAEHHWVDIVLAAEPDCLFVGNSMPVRDLDRFGRGLHGMDVAANRGLSGIDGTIATAAGIARASPDKRTFAVIGDVAAAHDLTSLRLAEGLKLIIIDNGGGRIFHQLPLDEPEFERLFATPPGIDLHAAIGAMGRTVQTVDLDGLPAALAGPADVVLLQVDGPTGAQLRRRRQTNFSEAANGA